MPRPGAPHAGDFCSASPADTFEFGRRIGARARPGDVFALVGPLGAGKTQLVKGLAAGLGATDDRDVCSPTFVLVTEHAGRLRLYHLDAYRLDGARPLEAIGFDELCGSGGVVAVEWADRVRALMPEETVWIEIEPRTDGARELHVSGPAEMLERLLA